jgi:hypothetical protein
MYGFEVGMEAIWKHQHPEDCSKAKFLIGGVFATGFGSEFHVLGAGMALAMKLNRVYLLLTDASDSGLEDKMASTNRFQVDIEYCRNQSKLSLDCYYEPWSSCTLQDALQGTSLSNLRKQGLVIPYSDLNTRPRDDRTVVVHLSSEVVDDITHDLLPMIHCSPFSPNKYRYYWRSLTAAYFLRPNEPTRQLIMQHRQDQEMRFDKEKDQCVSVYIRRGDKHIEMKIIEDETIFFNQAKELSKHFKTPSGEVQEKGIMFLGSEDPKAMDTAQDWGKKNDFTVLYSNLFDRRSVTTAMNHAAQRVAKATGAFVHHDMEYFSMVLNIDAHLRCNAFVCTHGSNFCRVIDEMRATVANKANRMYADFSCGHPPPCIDCPETDIDW